MTLWRMLKSRSLSNSPLAGFPVLVAQLDCITPQCMVGVRDPHLLLLLLLSLLSWLLLLLVTAVLWLLAPA